MAYELSGTDAWRAVSPEPEAACALAGALGLPAPLGQVLLNRGYRTEADADRFLRPRLSGLADPFDIPGMPAAAERLVQAARRRERVVVFGDYDADGITAAALLHRVLGRLGMPVRTFLPDRLQDGYGLTAASLDHCLESGPADVVVTVDCGTNACEAARWARRKSVDLVITDHHQPSLPAPDAVAVVNPRYAESGPWHDLAGVGVAFKLAHAVVKQARHAGLPGAENLDLRTYLDWVALGTVADSVPLRDENRILVRYGLQMASRDPSPGVAALCRVAGLRDPLEAWHLGYALAPRINAAGRLASPDAALALLLGTEPERTMEQARALDRLNRDRQRIESAVVAEAMEQARAQGEREAWTGRVAAGSDWHPGVIGIVAARLGMHFRQPAVVFSLRPDGGGRGSGRGPEGFNLVSALSACADHLERFGGHAAAAGLELKPGQLNEFREAFSDAVRRSKPDTDASAALADGVLGPADADDRFLDALDGFRPFGVGNPPPRWLGRGVRVVSSQAVGGGKHRRFRLADGGTERSAIGFNLGERGAPPGRVDLIFEVQRNTFAGRTEVQLKILDWRPAGASHF